MKDLHEVLLKTGLPDKDAQVYLALLKLGETTATKLAETTNLDRTLMYQITNRLIEQGFASYVVKNNVRYFSAASPEALLKYMQEREQTLREALPEFNALRNLTVPGTKVEVYRGREGVNTILKMILRDGKPYCINGGASEACTIFEHENMIFAKRAETQKLPGRILARKSDTFFIGSNEEFRYLPDHQISSTTMVVWDGKTAIFVWSAPYYAILVTNEEIARSNLVSFDYLWELAVKVTPKEVKKRLIP